VSVAHSGVLHACFGALIICVLSVAEVSVESWLYRLVSAVVWIHRSASDLFDQHWRHSCSQCTGTRSAVEALCVMRYTSRQSSSSSSSSSYQFWRNLAWLTIRPGPNFIWQLGGGSFTSMGGLAHVYVTAWSHYLSFFLFSFFLLLTDWMSLLVIWQTADKITVHDINAYINVTIKSILCNTQCRLLN